MANTTSEFQFDVFLSHSAKAKAVVRPLAERLRQDGLKVWFDEWVLKPGNSIPAKIDPPSLRRCGGTGEGLEHPRFEPRPSDFWICAAEHVCPCVRLGLGAVGHILNHQLSTLNQLAPR